jgi:hypothetical protein
MDYNHPGLFSWQERSDIARGLDMKWTLVYE